MPLRRGIGVSTGVVIGDALVLETEETRALISKLGVDYAQGHFIGRPISLDSVLSDLSQMGSASKD